MDHLPPALVHFLAEHGLEDSYALAGQVPRYLRLRTRPQRPGHGTDAPPRSLQEARERLEAELGVALAEVPWLRGFYSLDASVRISTMPMYKRGWAVGMDAASGLCVRALDIAADDRVLDLCCAPGIKLCAIADELEVRAGVGSVTGVDVSEKRLVVCRSQVRKMGVTRCRLFCADGTAFGVPPPFLDWTLCPDGARSSGTPAAAKRKPFYASRLLASPLCDAGSPRLYNKVLVDADCTTEGSLNHVRKMAQWTKEHGGDGELLAGRPFAAEDLPELQFALLENSFRMCEPGGVIVYSTCSLTRQQNEEVVARFLEAHGNEAELDELPFDRTTPKSWRSFAAQYPAAMNMDRTWRFDPSTQTSGLFIARFRRR